MNLPRPDADNPGCLRAPLSTRTTSGWFTGELRTEVELVVLGPGQLYTVPAGMAHVTSPLTDRSVNITVERMGMTTERVQDPPASR